MCGCNEVRRKEWSSGCGKTIGKEEGDEKGSLDEETSTEKERKREKERERNGWKGEVDGINIHMLHG